MDDIKNDLYVNNTKNFKIETYKIDDNLYLVKRISVLDKEYFTNLKIKNIESIDNILSRLSKFNNLERIIEIIEKDKDKFLKEKIDQHFHLFQFLEDLHTENIILGRVKEDKEKYEKFMNINIKYLNYIYLYI